MTLTQEIVRFKIERIYQTHDKTHAHASLNIVDWLEGYTISSALRTSIDFLTPVYYEAGLIAVVRENEAGSVGYCLDPATG
ncbi:hypothetical protein WT08_23150 [Burkholderia sp. MSMB1552]|nr:hypothetical protein WT08_23150 [Burkholderia sp. MSMB1552]KWZ55895.1 hypothetical protein WS92_08210 [Burkholderia sp. MSMB1588]